MISMESFLRTEALTGGLHPERLTLPKKDVNLAGPDLWYYINKVSDVAPGTHCPL